MSLGLDRLVACFDAISLAEVDGRAALQTRADNKYIVELETFERVAGALVPDYLALEVAGKRFSVYDTVYFDTPGLHSYRQHRQGRRRRFKCRTRLYGNRGPCFFEVKLKSGREETVKRRLRIDRAEHGLFTPAAHDFLERELEQAYGGPEPSRLAPTLRSVYARLTLVSRVSKERVTCDFELGFSTAAVDGLRILPGRVLLETKSERGNGDADRLLRSRGHRPVSGCSKYCLGIALARSDVGNNRFRPLLRRHFEAPVPSAQAAA